MEQRSQAAIRQGIRIDCALTVANPGVTACLAGCEEIAFPSFDFRCPGGTIWSFRVTLTSP
jgi:hypothetical protein